MDPCTSPPPSPPLFPLIKNVINSTFLIGLILTILLKFANFSNNPFWVFMSDYKGNGTENGGWNKVGIIIGLMSLFQVGFGGIKESVLSTPTPGVARESEKQQGGREMEIPSSITTTLAFGTLFFLLHLLFSDAGTLIAYVSTGLSPSLLPAPIAMPHGLLTLLALSFGLYLSQTLSRKFLLGTEWYAFALASLAIFVLGKNWTGYLAGLGLGIWTFSVFPSFLSGMNGGGRWAIAMGWYVLLVLGSTFTVAYAFVPFGWIFREKDQEMLIGLGGLIFPGLCDLRRTDVDYFDGSSSDEKDVKSINQKRHLRLIFLLPLLGLLIASYRLLSSHPLSSDTSNERLVTAGIWTMHFALDGRAWESQRRMRWIFEEAGVDIVGLLESDLQRIVMGNRDMFVPPLLLSPPPSPFLGMILIEVETGPNI